MTRRGGMRRMLLGLTLGLGVAGGAAALLGPDLARKYLLPPQPLHEQTLHIPDSALEVREEEKNLPLLTLPSFPSAQMSTENTEEVSETPSLVLSEPSPESLPPQTHSKQDDSNQVGSQSWVANERALIAQERVRTLESLERKTVKKGDSLWKMVEETYAEVYGITPPSSRTYRLVDLVATANGMMTQAAFTHHVREHYSRLDITPLPYPNLQIRGNPYRIFPSKTLTLEPVVREAIKEAKQQLALVQQSQHSALEALPRPLAQDLHSKETRLAAAIENLPETSKKPIETPQTTGEKGIATLEMRTSALTQDTIPFYVVGALGAGAVLSLVGAGILSSRRRKITQVPLLPYHPTPIIFDTPLPLLTHAPSYENILLRAKERDYAGLSRQRGIERAYLLTHTRSSSRIAREQHASSLQRTFDALYDSHGKIQKSASDAARELGVSTSTIYRRSRRLAALLKDESLSYSANRRSSPAVPTKPSEQYVRPQAQQITYRLPA